MNPQLRQKPTGSRLNIKTVFPGMEFSIIKIRRSWDSLIFIMGIPIMVRRRLYIETPLGIRPHRLEPFNSYNILYMMGTIILGIRRHSGFSVMAWCQDILYRHSTAMVSCYNHRESRAFLCFNYINQLNKPSIGLYHGYCGMKIWAYGLTPITSDTYLADAKDFCYRKYGFLWCITEWYIGSSVFSNKYTKKPLVVGQ